MKKPPSIGLLGGTFDPVHNGHLQLAHAVRQRINLDAIHFIPAAQPLLRTAPLAEADIRLHMLHQALENDKFFQVDEREIKRGGPSYMIDTLQEIRGELPHASLCLIVGIDQFVKFNQWKRWEHLPHLAHIIVTSRQGYKNTLPLEVNNFYKAYCTKDINALHETVSGYIFSLQLETLPISSTIIRQKIRQKENVIQLLPKKVWAFIEEKRLYVNS